MNLDHLAKIISNSYHFQVLACSKLTEQSYRLETNVGPKRLSVWYDQALVTWAFAWREQLACLGYRQIDRFIRHQQGGYYVEREGVYLVVQDLFLGEVFTPQSREQYRLLGLFVGSWYKACMEATRQLSPPMRERLAETLGASSCHLERSSQGLKTYKEKIDALADSMSTYLIRQHWPSLAKRYRQASLLEEAGQAGQREFLFPKGISLDEWRLTKEGYVVFQRIDEEAAFDLGGIAQFLQCVYLDEQATLADIEAWYLGFCQAFPTTIHTHYHLLGRLIFPRRHLEILSSYLNQEEEEERCMEAWLKACQEQTRLDELHLFLAQLIDREKEERGLGS